MSLKDKILKLPESTYERNGGEDMVWILQKPELVFYLKSWNNHFIWWVDIRLKPIQVSVPVDSKSTQG